MHQTTRREFLGSSLTAAASVAALGQVRAADPKQDANSRIRAAVVGVGGRSKAHIKSLIDLAGDNIELAAMCDVDETVLKQKAAEAEKQTGKKIQTFTDMRKLFDDRTIDVVTFATPNHWHALGTIWACQAGKDVYVEKPGSHNIFEGRIMVEAARKHSRIVQHGTQCRSSPLIREGIEKLHKGVIGEVYMARGIAYKTRPPIGKVTADKPAADFNYDRWLGPAPMKQYSKVAHRRWHNFWDTGNGEIGNQGVHQMDVIRWGLNLDQHPARVQSMGGMFVHEDSQETPSTQVAAFQYAGRNILVDFAIRHWYTNTEAGMGDVYPFVDGKNVVGVVFYGSKGYMVFPDYSSYHTFLGPKREPGPQASDPSNPMIDLPHFKNFFHAVRSRKRTDLAAEIEEGHKSSAMCHLANIAYRLGRTLEFDSSREQFKSDEQANRMLTREYREPFLVPRKV